MPPIHMFDRLAVLGNDSWLIPIVMLIKYADLMSMFNFSYMRFARYSSLLSSVRVVKAMTRTASSV
jgi:hypothetical protein